ncbi:MAG: putative quinol monooxygenase [Acidimicrobiales bacterium]
MLIVAGTIRIEPEHRDQMFAAVAPMVAATRAEPGCRAYSFSPDVDDPGLVHLYELWEDQAALDAHFVSEHMATWRQASAGLPILGRDIAKYIIAEVGTLP